MSSSWEEDRRHEETKRREDRRHIDARINQDRLHAAGRRNQVQITATVITFVGLPTFVFLVANSLCFPSNVIWLVCSFFVLSFINGFVSMAITHKEEKSKNGKTINTGTGTVRLHSDFLFQGASFFDWSWQNIDQWPRNIKVIIRATRQGMISVRVIWFYILLLAILVEWWYHGEIMTGMCSVS